MSGKVVIVLGLEPDERDEPKPELRVRIETAAALWQPGTRLIVSGGRQPGHRLSEAEIMAGMLTARGIPESDILLEAASLSTRGNLENTARMIEAGSDITVVTSDYHVFRARRLAGKAGLKCRVTGAETPGGLPKLRLMLMEGCYLLSYAIGWEETRPVWITKLFNALFSGHAR